MRARVIRIGLFVGVLSVVCLNPAQAWRGGFGGFRAGGFHAGGFGLGGGLGGFSSFHAGGFGGGFGAVGHAGWSHLGPVTGLTHVSAGGGVGPHGYGGGVSATHVGWGGAQHYSGWGGSAWGGAHYGGSVSTYHPHNYGSISHYSAGAWGTWGHAVATPAGYGAAVVHGPMGGTMAAYHGPVRSGAVVKGPAGGVVAGYHGPYSAGEVSVLPSGYTAASWHGATYYHAGFSFYHPVYRAGTVSYVAVPPPTGWFFTTLPVGAAPVVINNVTYYSSGDVYYQASSQDGKQGYIVVKPPPGAPPAEPAIIASPPPNPFELVKKMSRYMGKQKHILMTVSEDFDQVALTGQKIQLSNERTVRVKRPDQIMLEVVGAALDRKLEYNGERFIVVDLLKNVYAKMPMSGSLDSVMDKLATVYGISQPVEDLLYSDVYAKLAPKIQSGQFVAREEVAGHKCNHLAFTQKGLSWQIWIDDSDKPVPWRLVTTYESAPGRPQYALQITKFETPLIMPAAEFRLAPPDGAMPASFLTLAGGLAKAAQ